MGCLSFLCGGPTDLPRPDSTYSQLLSENTLIKDHDLDPSFGEHAIGELEQEEAWLTREPEAAHNEPDAEPSVVIAHRGNTSIHKLLPRDRMRAGAERKVHIHEASSAPVEYWEDSPSSPPAPLVAPSSGVESYPLPETANRGRMPAPGAHSALGCEDELGLRGPRRVRGLRSSPPSPLQPPASPMPNGRLADGRLGGQKFLREACDLRATSSAACPPESVATKSGRRNVNGTTAIMGGGAVRRRRCHDRSGTARRDDP
ncbi:hypothetical protein LXA43DRAFT_1047677 [Ganoderma leucocontextum]|nr:hypothetical protein LXA43DRAFT_1047677 [Ganoderma leucocontextum]